MLGFEPRPLPATLLELAPHHRAQLDIAARFYDGGSAAQRMEGSRTGEGETELWALVEDGVTRYELWILASDSGALFDAGTARPIGEVIQFGYSAPDEHLDSWKEIAAAERAPYGTGPYRIDFSLEAE